MPLIAPVLTPPLRQGEHLTRDEFMRRWEAMPDLTRAELINGIVHMPSPVSRIHGDFHGRLSGWLWSYSALTKGCGLYTAGTWLMSRNSAPQPDLAFEILPEYGGQARIEGKYSAGAPELIVEVSHTTSARDTGVKLRLYEQCGVREYLIVRPAKQQLSWRELHDGKYREIAAGPDGWFRSRVFPGLWLNPEALWNHDLPGLAEAVNRGAATTEHAAFARKLAASKR